MHDGPPGTILLNPVQSQVLLAAAMNSKDARKQGRRDARVLERRAIQATNWDRPRQESGAAAWLVVKDLESELERRASVIAQEVSSAEWLFFLRRAPWLFDGYEPLGSGYLTAIGGVDIRAIAEATEDL